MSTKTRWIRALAALGLTNVARVASYRIGLKLGLHPVQRIAATVTDEGHYFVSQQTAPVGASLPTDWQDTALLFGAHRVPIAERAPSWHLDPFESACPDSHDPSDLPVWWKIGDFSGGDIKSIWELSRFDWVLAFAQQAREGDASAKGRLERWLADWAAKNPPYRGPNWKCAQEASIRLLHLSLGAIILSQENEMTHTMRSLIDAHIRRILPTLSFARAQDNNHATSEAAAIYVAGAWYHLAGIEGADALSRRGRKLLERSVLRLFGPDGSFSQYSLNYHRFALDTLSVVEIWRRRAGLDNFGEAFGDRVAAAARWLRAMTQPTTGDAPNLGANDGANLLPLTSAAFRDHRPAVQLACHLFCDIRAYGEGPWDDALAWLGLSGSSNREALQNQLLFDDGGYAIMRDGDAMAMLRYPRFRFRPSQADALHLDLWHDGQNLLRDGGSYSYNTDQKWIDYFGGVEAHNTIQFDGAEQMPRLSRFLLGDWLQTEAMGRVSDGYFAAYRYPRGAHHRREFTLTDHLRVVDTIGGFTQEARMRWRLSPGAWRAEGNVVTNGAHRFIIKTDGRATITLIEGWESRHYHEKTRLPVVEVVIPQPCTIVTEYRWSP